MLVKLNGKEWYSTSDVDNIVIDTDRFLRLQDPYGIEDSVSSAFGLNDIGEFLKTLREEGLFHAIYGKSFFEVISDFFINLIKDIFKFLLGNADLFFLLPAIFVMFATFLVGRNKYTRCIVPLWFAYFVANFFHKSL